MDHTSFSRISTLRPLKMDTIRVWTCLSPSAAHSVVKISSKDFKGLHLDSRCKHIWTAVTSPRGLEYHQSDHQSDRRRPGPSLNRTKMRHQKGLFVLQTKTLNIISCSRVSLSPYNAKRKQQEVDKAGRRAHHSGTLVMHPEKTTSQQCTHQWGCVSEAILQMSLLCPLSPGWAGHCVRVIDTRRHGEAACDISAAVSFMQLHRRRQDTSNHAHRCHHCVCVPVRRDLVPDIAVRHNRESRGTLHLSLWILSAQMKRRSTVQVVCASVGKVWH